MCPVHNMEMLPDEERDTIEDWEPPKDRRFMEAGMVPTKLFSGLAKAVSESPLGKATAEQWQGWLSKQPGVKLEELEWTGFKDFLDSKRGSALTREEASDFVRSNQVDVQEVVKGQGKVDPVHNAFMTRIEQRIADGDHVPPHERAQYDRDYDAWSNTAGHNDTKFSQYQLPGGENYRELLLTLPPHKTEAKIGDWGLFNGDGRMRQDSNILEGVTEAPFDIGNQFGRISRLPTMNGGEMFVVNSPNMQNARFPRLQDAVDAINQSYNGQRGAAGDYMSKSRDDMFRSPHFDEPNVLAHVRFNDRVDASGKKTLFLEEIQSDWHQKGRKQGYKTGKPPRSTKEIDADIDAVRAELKQREPNLNETSADSWTEAWERHPDLAQRDARLFEERSEPEYGAVPDAPFKTAWPELSLKRMIKWAADNGYDQIAWTPGKVQADRYNLANHLESISVVQGDNGTRTWWPRDRNGQDLGSFTTDADGVVTKANSIWGDATLKHVDEVVGKDVAARGMDPNNARETKLSGVDLSLGGEGMKAFYDKMLVGAANKLGKKFGAKVQTATIGPPSKYKIVRAEDGSGWQVQYGNDEPKGLWEKRADVDAYVAAHVEGEAGQHEVWSLPITDAMRKEVGEKGMPLFEAGAVAAGGLALTDERVRDYVSSSFVGQAEAGVRLPTQTLKAVSETGAAAVKGAAKGAVKGASEAAPKAAYPASGEASTWGMPVGKGLLEALDARAKQMELGPKDRVKPDVEPTPLEAFEGTAAGGTEDAASLYPRLTREEYLKPDKKGNLPAVSRVVPLIDHKEEIAQALAKRMESERGKNTQYFYHTGIIGTAARSLGFTKQHVNEWLDEFAKMYAATSPRTETAQNIRNATLAMAKKEAGIPITEVVGKGTGGMNEKGYPMMLGEGGIHRQLIEAAQGEEGINRMSNPKPWNFSKNVAGDLSGVTVDTHAIRAALDVLNEMQPGSIEAWIKPKFREAYKEDPSRLDPATWIDDTLGSVSRKGVSMQVEYGPVADIYHRAAEILGVQPAEAQSMGWFASGKRTGLASERKTIVDLLNERINVTAKVLGLTDKQVATKLLKREIPLLTLLTAALPEDKAEASPVDQKNGKGKGAE